MRITRSQGALAKATLDVRVERNQTKWFEK